VFRREEDQGGLPGQPIHHAAQWVIVDLADLEGIGYTGLSVLLRVLKWTRRSGGDLSLAAPQQPVRRILEITGLIDVFSVYPSVEEAANTAGHGHVRAGAGKRLAVQCAAWPVVASQPSRCDIARAQLTTARTWPEASVARHSTDHG
jgi:ABC-type transporter Mla MlaB component